MSFRDYATTETAAVIRRLLAQSADQDRRELDILKRLLTAATEATDAAAARPELVPDEEVAALAGRLSEAAAGDAARAVEAARAEILAAREQLKTIDEKRRAAENALAAAREQLKAADEKRRTAENATVAAREQIKAADEKRRAAENATVAAREQIKAADEKRRAAESAVASTRDELKSLDEKRRTAEATFQAERKSAATKLKAATERVAALEGELGALKTAQQALSSRLDAAVAAEQAAQKRVADADREAARARSDAQAARVAAAEAEKSRAKTAAAADALRKQQVQALRHEAVALASRTLGHVVTVLAAFETCTTVNDALRALATGLASEFSRVALFRVQENGLHGTEQFGFDAVADISNVLMPLTADSILTRAVSTQKTEYLVATDRAAAAAVPFGGSPAFAIALPVVVSGQVIAVLYADDADQPNAHVETAELRRRVADLLLLAASPWLRHLTPSDATQSTWHEYAALLVSELERAHGADVAAKTPEPKRRKRLHETIECARQLYVQRTGADPAASGVLHQRLVEASRRPGSAFARDLAAVLSAARNASAARPKTAEAS